MSSSQIRPKTALLGKRGLDGGGELGAVGGVLAGPAAEELALLADEPLVEVPFHVAREAGLRGEPGEERVLLGALLHVHLGELVEGGPVLQAARLDLLDGAGLVAEVVADEAEHREAPVLVLAIDL